MVTVSESPLAVIGAGSWGTALAVLLARNGVPTWLWGREPERLAAMAADRCNAEFLPGIAFPDRLAVEHDLGRVLERSRDVLVAVPSAGFRATLERVRDRAGPGIRLAWATKGLEPDGGRLLHEVAREVFGEALPMAVLSGPTFAREVAAGLPTAMTLASNDPRFAHELGRRLHGERFRVYTATDVIGVEVGGAVKNVLAIAAGIADGLGFGANTRAALITRGLAEITRLGVALGGQRDTFMGLAGLGDLVLTCTDDQSRNRRLGLALARGTSLGRALEEIGQVVEGVATARELTGLAATHGAEMPICEQVHRVLHEGKNPHAAVAELFAREPKAEEFA